ASDFFVGRRWQLEKLSSMNIRLLILVLVLIKPLGSICADPAPITQEELVRRAQELFDAVVPGNKEPWQKYFADDCIFADEKGRNFNKTQLIADIAPLPKGYSGTIKVVKPQSVIHGDTAILSYDLDETETIFGQKLTARYHVTDTWLRRKGLWQIASSQAMRYYEDPAVGRSDPKKFGDFDGTYEVAPGQIRRVFSEGENLYVERNGKREQLLPEGCEIFFRRGVEGRILFRYTANGKVDALIDRRNNEDVVWRRMD
ncbi:MAG TPA: nuclear transport factor 2 family protein, partial [Candidatus Udaeobacter sp.]